MIPCEEALDYGRSPEVERSLRDRAILIANPGFIGVERRLVASEDGQVQVEEDAAVLGFIGRSIFRDEMSLGRFDQPDRSAQGVIGQDALQHLFGERGAPLFVIVSRRLIDRIVKDDSALDREWIAQSISYGCKEIEQGLRMAPAMVSAVGAGVQPPSLLNQTWWQHCY